MRTKNINIVLRAFCAMVFLAASVAVKAAPTQWNVIFKDITPCGNEKINLVDNCSYVTTEVGYMDLTTMSYDREIGSQSTDFTSFYRAALSGVRYRPNKIELWLVDDDTHEEVELIDVISTDDVILTSDEATECFNASEAEAIANGKIGFSQASFKVGSSKKGYIGTDGDFNFIQYAIGDGTTSDNNMTRKYGVTYASNPTGTATNPGYNQGRSGLFQLAVNPSVVVGSKYYGHTLKIKLSVGNSFKAGSTVASVHDIYFDLVSHFTPADDTEGIEYFDSRTVTLSKVKCDSDPTLKMTNDADIFGVAHSALGKHYTAEYQWRKAEDTWGDFPARFDGKEAKLTGLCGNDSRTTGYVVYTPYAVLYDQNGVERCQIAGKPEYHTFYFHDLETTNYFQVSGVIEDASGTKGVAAQTDNIEVCYGDNVIYTPRFWQQVLDMGEVYMNEDYYASGSMSTVYWTLEEVGGELYDNGGIPFNLADDPQEIDLGPVTKDRTFNLTAFYYSDFTPAIRVEMGSRDESDDCYILHKTFTIKVRSMDATATIDLPSEPVCEESSPEIKASIGNIPTSTTAADYAYKWEVSSDGGNTYAPFGGAEWLVSGDAGWVNPTGEVVNVDANVEYPTANTTHTGFKNYKFLYANTFLITDTEQDPDVTTRYFCPLDKEAELEIHKLPVLEDKTYTVCKGQPIDFDVVFTENVAIPNGLEYKLYTTNTGGVVSGLTELDGKVTSSDSKKATYHINNATKNAGEVYEYYATATDKRTGCVSHVATIIIKVLPLPEVSNFVADKTQYCKDGADIVNLKLSVDLSSDFENFDWDAFGVTKPEVVYHWYWMNSNGTVTKENYTTSVPSIDGSTDVTLFDGLSSVIGNVDFSVFASTTGDDQCGLVLEADKTPVDPLSPATTTADGIVKIVDLPQYEISEEKECSSEGSATFTLESKDDRTLTFKVTRTSTMPQPDGEDADGVTTVVVPGNSSKTLTIPFAEVDKEIEHVYTVKVTDDSPVTTCEDDAEMHLTLHPVPHLLPAAEHIYYVCEGEPIDFDVKLDVNHAKKNQWPLAKGKSITYKLYTDAGLTTETTCDGVAVAKNYSKATYSITNAVNGATGKYTFWATAMDDTYQNCVSAPVEIVVYVLPLPQVTKIEPSVTAYCKDDQTIKTLQLTATLSSEYTSFDWAAIGKTAPQVTFHWSWEDAKGTNSNTATTVDDNIFNDGAGEELIDAWMSALAGNAKVRVWATDGNECGYDLKADGTPISTTSGVLTVAEAVVAIKTLPDMKISKEEICSNLEEVEVTFTSKDSRDLKFTITPSSEVGAPVPTETEVNVPGNTSKKVKFTFSEIDKETVFSYDVKVQDNTALKCEGDTTITITLYAAPHGLPIATQYVCKDQPLEFTVEFDGDHGVPGVDGVKWPLQSGMTLDYSVYTNYNASTKELSGEYTFAGVNKKADGTSVTYTIGGESATVGQLTYYSQIKETLRGCKSEPQVITINVLPVPQLTNLVAQEASYCVGDDNIANMKLTVEKPAVYDDDAYWTGIGLTKPTLTYHWDWANADNSVKGSKETSEPEIDGGFVKELSSVVGPVTITVWASDDANNCGYQLDTKGKIVGTGTNVLTPAEKVVEITDLPKFEIGDAEKCSNENEVNVTFTALEAKDLTFEIEPSTEAGAPVAAVSTVAVSGNSSETVKFTFAEIDATTDFKYNVLVKDAANCQKTHELTIRLYAVPKLTPAVYTACQAQPYTFRVNFEKNVELGAAGLEYKLYTTKTGDVLSGETTLAGVSVATDFSYADYTIANVTADEVTYYAQATDLTHGCKSAPVEIKIVKRPLPQVETLTVSASAFCQNNPAISDLVLNATLTDEYKNFDWAAAGATEPVVTYHWSWKNADNSVSGKSTSEGDKNGGEKNGGLPSDLSQSLGNVTFTVWATDEAGCGYELDAKGNHSGDVCVTTSVENSTLKIQDEPKYTVEDVQACWEDGTTVNIGLKSSDSRALTFTITPQAGSPAVASATVVVPGDGSTVNMQVPVVVADVTVSDITKFKYDIHVDDDVTPLSCSKDDEIEFTAYPLPSATFTLQDDKPRVCQQSSFKIKVNPTIKENGKTKKAQGDFTYSWTLDGAPLSWTGWQNTWTTDETTTPGTHTFTVVVTHNFADGHVCQNTFTQDVFVNELPDVTFTVDNATICEGDEATLSYTVNNASALNSEGTANDYEYTIACSNAPTGTYGGETTYPMTYKVSPTEATTYTLTVLNTVTGCTYDFTQNVDVKKKGQIKIVSVTPDQICAGTETITIGYEITNADKFDALDLLNTLTIDGNAADSYDEAAKTITYTAHFDSNGDAVATKTFGTNVVMKTTDGCDVDVIATKDLKVNPIPAAPIVTGATHNIRNEAGVVELCEGEEVTSPLVYTVSKKTGFEYHWYIQNTEPTGSEEPFKVTTATSPNLRLTGADTKTITESTKVWVRAIDKSSGKTTQCPSAFVSFDITVHKLPEPKVATVEKICQDETTTLVVTDPTSTDYYYVFSDEKGVKVTADDNTTPSYTTPNLSESTKYYLSVKEIATGCTNTTKVEIPVEVHTKPTAKTSVVCADAGGSTNILLPNGSNVTRQGYCSGEEGMATVTIESIVTYTGAAITSDLVAVSAGDVSDWTKIDETTWQCVRTGAKTWDAETTLTFKITDDKCTSEDITATVVVREAMPAPVIALNAEAAEVCYDANEAVVITMSDYAAMTANTGFRLVSEDTESNPGVFTDRDEFVRVSGEWKLTTSTEELGIKETTNFYIYAYDKKTGCVSPKSAPVQVLVHKLPIPNVVSDDADDIKCPGEAVVLTIEDPAAGMPAYTAYSWPDESTAAAETQSVTVYPTETTTYHYKVTDEYGCESLLREYTVTVKPRPRFTLAASPAVVCQGTSDEVVITPSQLNGLGTADNLTFDEPYIFTLSSPTGSTATVTTTDEGGTYKYAVTGHTWTEASVTFLATIKSSAADNACESEPVAVSIEVVSELPKPDAQTVSVQDGTTKTKTVHVCADSNEPITVTVENVSEFDTKSGTVSYSYHWYTDAAATNELTNGGDYTVDAAKGTITFVPTAVTTTSMTLFAKARRETAPNCESEVSDVVTVIIEALPAAPTALDASDMYVCQPEEAAEIIKLNVASPADENTYIWYKQNNGEGDTDMTDDIEVARGKGAVAAEIGAPTETTYLYARTLSQYLCLSDDKSNVIAIEVRDNPVIKEVTAPPTDVCEGEAFSMTVGVEGPSTGVTYTYIKTSPDNALLYETGTIDEVDNGVLSVPAGDVTVNQTERWDYEFRAVYGGSTGCLSDKTVKYSVTVHGDPTWDAPVHYDICEGSDLNVELKNMQSNDGGTGVKVTLLDKDGNIIASDLEVLNGKNLSYSIEGIQRTWVPIKYKVKDNRDGNKCELEGVFDIQVNAIPNFDVKNNDGEVDATPTLDYHTYDYCVGQSMELSLAEELPTVDPDFGVTITYAYQWLKGGVEIPGEVSTTYAIPTLTSGDEAEYTLRVTANGCQYYKKAQVNVHDLPEPTIVPGSDIDYYCMDGDFKAASGESYAQYRWEVWYDNALQDANAGTDSAFVYPLADKTFITDIEKGLGVRLYVVDKYDCVSTLYAEYQGDLAFPPVISEVHGTETCSTNPFSITVLQDKAEYSLALYDAKGDALPAGSYTLEDSDHRIVTSNDLAEGTYTIEVTDGKSHCTTRQAVELKRYDIDIEIATSTGSHYYCANGAIDYSVTLTDKFGHDDFLTKVTTVNYTIEYLDKDDNIVASDPTVTLTEMTYDHATIVPMNIGLVASNDPYRIRVKIDYDFDNDTESLTACVDAKDYEVYVVPTPVLASAPEMPACLGTKYVFSIDKSNIKAAAPKFKFYINGVEVTGRDESSNELDMADIPSITLVEGDVISAKVLMDENSDLCASNELTVTYHPDFKVELALDEASTFCQSQDIAYTLTSVTPDGLDPMTHVNVKIAKYTLVAVNANADGTDLVYEYGPTEADPAYQITTPNTVLNGNIAYAGDLETVDVYAIAEDVNGCKYKTDVKTFKIKQFSVSSIVAKNAFDEEIGLTDLCADVEYYYQATILDGSGNKITPADGYDFYFYADGTIINAHDASTPYTSDKVAFTHAVSSTPVDITVEVIDRATGCKIEIGSVYYPAFTAQFTYHAIPDPNVQLVEALLPITDDVDDATTYEVCYGNTFSLDVTGNIVTVFFDGNEVAMVAATAALIGEADITPIAGGTMTSTSYDGDPMVTRFTFDLDPSAAFHDIQFVVSDGACEQPSEIWKFRKYEEITVSAKLEGVEQISSDDILTLCVGNQIDIVPSTNEPGYTKGYNISIDGTMVTPSDFSAMKLAYEATAVGTYTVKFEPDFGRNGCSKEITIVVNEAPKPEIEMTDEAGSVITPIAYDPTTFSYTYDRCESLATGITAKGANSYTLTVSMDGKDVTSKFVGSGTGAEFEQSKTFYYDEASATANGRDYNEYVLRYTYAVGNCYDYATATIRVYQRPHAEFENGTPKPIVIEGTQVPVEVTAGFANYEFFLNDVSVQSGASNVLAAADNVVTVDTEVKVLVTSIHGCDTTLTANIKVVEGIKPVTVTADRDYYCTDDEGVTITLEGMQDGVTYKVVESPALLPITGAVDHWSAVRLPNPTVTNPQTFTVVAYYDIPGLTDETYEMGSVVIEEVASPSGATSMPDMLVDNCEELKTLEWTVTKAEYGMSYFLMREGTTEPIKGPFMTSDPSETTIAIPMSNIAAGTYHVAVRNKRLDGVTYVCEKMLPGEMVVDIATTELFDVMMTPANGLYCTDDKAGITIQTVNPDPTIDKHSDYTTKYPHWYALLMDGVEIARKESKPNGRPIVFENVTLPAGVKSATFEILCYFNGCPQMMNNSVTVTAVEPAAEQTLTADNFGYYCGDEVGLTLTVSGQQDGYQYVLKRDGYAYGDVHIGDASGKPFTFEHAIVGTYTVEAQYIGLETCVTSTNKVKVTDITLPLDPDIAIGTGDAITAKADTICVGEFATIALNSPQRQNIADDKFEVTYELYDEDGVSLGMFSDDKSLPVLKFPLAVQTVPGEYKYTVIATKKYKVDDLGNYRYCYNEFEDAVLLVVKPRPLTAETTHQEIVDPTVLTAEPCYGIDIVVDNAVTDDENIVYQLYVLNKKGVKSNYPIATLNPTKEKAADPAKTTFYFADIRDADGNYEVWVTNGYCEDLVGTENVKSDKLPKVQQLVVDGAMCEFDKGVEVRLEDSEKNTSYALYFVPATDVKIPEEDIDVDYLESLSPRLLNTQVATLDHQMVIFEDLDYADRAIDDKKYGDLLRRDGYYYLVITKTDDPYKCEVKSPYRKFQTRKLPKSFDLRLDEEIYCGSPYTAGVKAYVDGSEFSSEATITYALMKVAEDGVSTSIVEMMPSNTSGRVEFNTILEEGTYKAAAIKEYTDGVICTSEMAYPVTVVKKPRPETLIADMSFDEKVCDGEKFAYEIPAASLADGLTYKLVPFDDESEVIESQNYDGTTPVVLTGMTATGSYKVLVSYNGACESVRGSGKVEYLEGIESNVIDLVTCDNVYTINRKYLHDGATYKLIDTANVVVEQVDYIEATVTDVTFTMPKAGEYTIEASYEAISAGKCATKLGKILLYNQPTDLKIDRTLYVCDNSATVYELSDENALEDGMTYYMTTDEETPYEIGSKGKVFNADGGKITFDVKAVGEYVIWASNPGYACMQPVGELHVVNLPKIDNTTKMSVLTCQSEIKVEDSYLQDGATYALVEGGVDYKTVVYDASTMTEVKFTGVKAGTYTVEAWYDIAGDKWCPVKIGDATKYAELESIDMDDYWYLCNGNVYNLTEKFGTKLETGATYFLTPEAETPTTGGQTNTGTMDLVYPVKEGVYQLWANYMGSDCMDQIGKLTVVASEINGENSIDEELCGDSYMLDATLLHADVTYTLSEVNGAVADVKLTTDGTTDVEFTGITAGEYIITAAYEGHGQVACQTVLGKLHKYGDLKDLKFNDVLYAKGAKSVTYSLTELHKADLELNARYYVVVDTMTTVPVTDLGKKYDAKSEIEFTLNPGDYKVWASYTDKNCLMSIGKVTVKALDDFDVLKQIDLIVCDNEVKIDTVYLRPGATYELLRAGVDTLSLTYDTAKVSVDDMVFKLTESGVYDVRAMYIVGGDTLNIKTLGKITKHDEFKVIGFNDKVYACGGDPVVYNLVAEHGSDMISGVRYYLTADSVMPQSSGEVGNIYTGKDIKFVMTESGRYSVWASYDDYKCITEIGNVDVSLMDLDAYEFRAVRSCEDDRVTFAIDSTNTGVTYQLYAHSQSTKTLKEVGTAVTGNDKPYSWEPVMIDEDADFYVVKASLGKCEITTNRVYVRAIDYDIEWVASNFWKDDKGVCSAADPELFLEPSQEGVDYYLVRDGKMLTETAQAGNGGQLKWTIARETGKTEFTVMGVRGNCTSPDMWPKVEIDFDAATPPTGRLTLYVQGVSYNSDSKDIPSVCPGSNVNVTAMVEGVNVKTYNFYRRLGNKKELRQTLPTNAFIPFAEDENIGGDITVSLSVTTYGGCEFAIADSITFHLGNDYSEEEHLVAKDGIYEYCYGEPGVKLAFINTPMAGYTYRLFKVYDETDSINHFDELIDIQEVPEFYNGVPVTKSQVDSLFFNGWGFGESSADYAEKGFYYVRVRTPEGCDLWTNTVEVIENPLPVDSTTEVFFAGRDADGHVDLTSQNFDFGVLDGGFMVLKGVKPNVRYNLIHTDIPGVVLETKTSDDVDEQGMIVFGPIRSLEVDREQYGVPDTLSNWGEGYYDIEAIDMNTNCSVRVGDVLFVDEELIAHDVEIYLKKNEMSRIVSLVPPKGYKYTKKYIEWSTKIDKVFLPVVDYDEDGRYVWDEGQTNDLDYTNYPGYVNNVNEGNIKFQLLPSVDETGKEIPINGTYGFVDVMKRYSDSNILPKDEDSKTGWFVYEKKPSFFGREQVKYQIYNSLFTDKKGNKLRVSNTATITILCGNEETGDSTSVFLIPNAFSPNGDGFNDVFKIIIPDKYQANSESKLEVFNRWGTLVYRSSGLQYGADGEWWDGTSKTSNMLTLGTKLPSGTYYYVFTVHFIDQSKGVKAEREMHGYIELRR
ncbi:MAG: gliding motility-associated C-terminal domain-containing protein [Bacteroidales bacterium]|nr:gliding motility-associated C-terminal domain-containing protein [Bacteroidales bacterium]